MMLFRTNCDRKSQFSGILTEPLNPRAMARFVLPNSPFDALDLLLGTP